MRKMQVDRFEEGYAVLVDENDEIYNVPRDKFGFALHAGDILSVTPDAGLPENATLLSDETEQSRALARTLMEKLKRKN